MGIQELIRTQQNLKKKQHQMETGEERPGVTARETPATRGGGGWRRANRGRERKNTLIRERERAVSPLPAADGDERL